MRKSLLLVTTLFISQTTLAQQALQEQAFIFANRGECAKAIEYAAQSNDDLVQKIISAKAILDNKCAHISVDYALRFVNENPLWPNNNHIKRRLELLALDRASPNHKPVMIDWFKNNFPLTWQGLKYYALIAPHALSSDSVKETWRQASFEPSEQSSFLKLYAKVLSAQDHLARLDNMLWDERVDQAEQMLILVDKKHRTQYLAHIAIIKRDKHLEQLFHRLTRQQQHSSGILYAYLSYKISKKLPVTKFELASALHIPIDKQNADKWWRVRSYYVRELMQVHSYLNAYKLASHHNCSERLNITQAQWLSGWLALRFLHKADLALQHFQSLYNNSGRPISLARGAYWLARSYKQLQDKEKAAKWMNAAAKYGNTFYGQIAQHELGFKKLVLPSLARGITQEELQQFSSDQGVRIISTLLKYNQAHLALAYTKSIFANASSPQYIAYCMDLIGKSAYVSVGIEAAREANFYGVFTKEYSYPLPFTLTKTLVEPALIYSIIRQESSFDQFAADPTDGRGLMQLIPSTAKSMAKLLGVAYNEAALFDNRNYNILLGSKHLAEHLKYYNGSYLLAIPAYNAGTHRVDKWISLAGDPRKLKDLYHLLDWIEKIPFVTTRDYVHRILENLQIYRSIINKDDALHVIKDLTRKN
jgi:soluble lytic murein transglycosylase